jgi:hypothetical protein
MADEDRPTPPARDLIAVPPDHMIELGQRGQGFLPVGEVPAAIAGQVGGMPVVQAEPAAPQASQSSPDALTGIATPQSASPQSNASE